MDRGKSNHSPEVSYGPGQVQKYQMPLIKFFSRSRIIAVENQAPIVFTPWLRQELLTFSTVETPPTVGSDAPLVMH